MTIPLSSMAADFHWARISPGQAWTVPGAWLEGAVPGISDRAVFGSLVPAVPLANGIIASGTTHLHIGSVLVLDGSTATMVNTNHGQAPIHVHGVGGIGAETNKNGIVNFFYHSYWEDDLVMRANNPAGGGWRIILRLASTGTPSGIDIGSHTITFDPVNAANSIEFMASTTVINGTGNVVKTGFGNLFLAGINTYSGTTNILQGTMQLSGSGSIASSSAVNVDGTLDISLTNTGAAVNALTGAGRVVLGARTLRLMTGGNVFAGNIEGTGGLQVNGDTWLNGTSTYSGGTSLLNGQLSLGVASALGTGALAMADGTTLHVEGLNLANDLVFSGPGSAIVDSGAAGTVLSGALSGSGGMEKIGAGALTLAGSGNYTGATSVTSGSLVAAAPSVFSAGSAYSIASGALLDLAGHAQSIASLQNGGVVSLRGSVPGTVLTVTGPYVGVGGVLRLSSVLGDSSSPSDRLLLDGPTAVASGQTSIEVAYAGGLGAPTTGDGIQLVGLLNGASYGSGAFSLAGGSVQAGAFTYTLNSTGSGVYLSSSALVNGVAVPNYRPEIALHASLPQQMRHGAMTMLGNLHQRMGDSRMAPETAELGVGMRHAWGRLISNETQANQAGDVSPESSARLNGFQAGTDLFAGKGWRAGVYVGQLEGKADVSGFVNGSPGAAGTSRHRSRYLGAYGTYLAGQGTYADVVVQTGEHDIDAQAAGGSLIRMRGNSLLASLEAGHPIVLPAGWTLEPQIQLIYRRQHLDDADIAAATIRYDNSHGWTTRTGLRMKGRMTTGAGVLQPYGRINLYRTTGGADALHVDTPAASTRISSAASGSWGEAALGFALDINPIWSAYGEIGRLFDTGGGMRVDSRPNAAVGFRARW
ncbi:autotransporter domain-containing protein [Variovorax sp. VNK109]|uniref:autotransporter family protein n=1 Tax=Variovorax sp. VNK109 TaxID=3400919 RepID=UPI003BFCF2CD